MMTGNEYQIKATATAIYPNIGSNFTYPALGLAGEAGEVCDKIKKVLRDDGGVFTEEKLAGIGKELGDVLWYVAALCNELGFKLEDIMQGNIDKLTDRTARGVRGGSGDDR
jgi:NTP pyrophosphatase (non-canonical NTP hydrolase)